MTLFEGRTSERQGDVVMAERLERHPLSVLCEDMPPEEYQKLVESVRQDGVIDYVIKTLEHEGEPHVLDGFHRYSAAHDAGETDGLIMTPYTGNDPVSYVRAKNLRRRHLTLGQRAGIEVALSEWAASGSPPTLIQSDSTGAPGSPPPATVAEMAEEAGVSERTIQQAKVAEEAGLGDAVRSGDLSPKAAAGQARGEPDAPKLPTKAERLDAERDVLALDVQDKAARIEEMEDELQFHRGNMDEQETERHKAFTDVQARLTTALSQINEWMTKANDEVQARKGMTYDRDRWRERAMHPCANCGTEAEWADG